MTRIRQSITAALVVSLETSAQVNVAATGGAIVAALNKRDLDGVLATMDVEAVSHIVLKGMGLSDADRESLRKGFGKALRTNVEIGMRAMDIEMRTWYGSPAYFVLGAVHAIVFWITVSVFTPLILIVCLINERRRCLHDILVGTVVINNEQRASALRASVRRPA